MVPFDVLSAVIPNDLVLRSFLPFIDRIAKRESFMQNEILETERGVVPPAVVLSLPPSSSIGRSSVRCFWDNLLSRQI
jgi:hypothetical protein